MSIPKIVIHTDVIIDFLLHDKESPSVLRMAMRKFFCYTTVFNAIELFSLAVNKHQVKAIEHTLSAFKILGLNARSAKTYGALFARNLKLPTLNVFIAGLCLESKLSILTGQPGEFYGIEGLVVVLPSMVLNNKIK